MPSIEVDIDVWTALQKEAEPFVDDPNAVLRRILGLDDRGPEKRRTSRHTGKASSRVERAPLGSLLPETEYELPILQELAARGGSAPAREITEAVGKRLADRLTDLDRQRLNSGDVRWENRVHFTRLTLRQRELLKADSLRGTWELTEKGRIAAKKERSR